MNEDQEKKLNDQIAFCNSIAQQFMVVKEEIGQDLGRLHIDLGRLQAENRELKALIEANRVGIHMCDLEIKNLIKVNQIWLEVCDSELKELKKNQHIHGVVETKKEHKPIDYSYINPKRKLWEFWK